MLTQPQPIAFLDSKLVEQAGAGVAQEAPQQQTGDPADWQEVSQWEGVAVTTVRRYFPSGKLRRIQSQQVGVEGPFGHHGLDLHYFENGTLKQRGSWRQGKLQGPYQEWLEGGSLSVSWNFENGLRDGLCREYGEDGPLRVEAEYQAGRLHGQLQQWFGSGDPQEVSHWDHGVQTGDYRLWERGHVPILHEQFLNGVRNGESITFHRVADKELVFVRGNYAAGEKHGEFLEYNEAGQLISKRHFRAGALEGSFEEWVEKVLVLSTHYSEGTENGERLEFYPSGKPFAKGLMKAGLREGPWSYWEEDGSSQARWSGIYESGTKVAELEGNKESNDGK